MYIVHRQEVFVMVRSRMYGGEQDTLYRMLGYTFSTEHAKSHRDGLPTRTTNYYALTKTNQLVQRLPEPNCRDPSI